MPISTNADRKSLPQTTPLEKEKKLIAGRYEVVNGLKGGMGIVYLCRDTKSGQPVALKTFKPEFLSHRAARDLFLREGTMWVELGQHPNIVRAYRVERIGDGREVYLVLEWVVQPRGKATPSLRSWLAPGRPMSLEDSLLFSLHVARGMKYATGKISGLVHRDIKPENILVGFDGIARVTDFGLASTLSGMSSLMGNPPEYAGDSKRTQLTQGVVGTPLYMAPEQWNHQPLDARADIYAMGCILYEMLTGQFAVQGDTREKLKEAHLTGKIKPPPSNLSRDIRMLLRRMLYPNANERYRNWTEVERAIEKVYKNETGREVPPEETGSGESRAEKIAAGDSYNMMGLSYLDIGKLDVAVMYFEQAVSVARSEGSLALEASALGNLGLAYTSMGYVDRAIDFHDEQMILAQEIKDKAEEGNAMSSMGHAYGRRGNNEEAMAYHEKSLEIFKELGDKFKQAAALYNLGESQRQLGDVKKAETFFKQSLVLAKEVGDQGRIKSVFRSMGRIYLNDGNIKEATVLFQQVLNLARKMGDRVGEGDALGDLGDLSDALGQPETALKRYQAALAIANESHDNRRLCRYLLRLGDLYLEIKDARQAEEYYKTALQAARELNDLGRQVESLHKQGNATMEIGDHMRAASYFREMQQIAQKMGDRRGEQQSILDLGEAYRRWGDLKRTADYYKDHIQISRELGDKPLEMKMLVKLGDLLTQIRHYKLAKDIFQQYLDNALKMGNKSAEMIGLYKLANAIRDRGFHKDSIEYYKAAHKLARELKKRPSEALILVDWGVALNDLGKKRAAGKTALQGYKLACKSKEAVVIAGAGYKLGLVFFQQGKIARAKPYIEKAHNLYVKLRDLEMAERTQLILAKIDNQ